jgi:hypothetical protein
VLFEAISLCLQETSPSFIVLLFMLVGLHYAIQDFFFQALEVISIRQHTTLSLFRVEVFKLTGHAFRSRGRDLVLNHSCLLQFSQVLSLTGLRDELGVLTHDHIHLCSFNSSLPEDIFFRVFLDSLSK